MIISALLICYALKFAGNVFGIFSPLLAHDENWNNYLKTTLYREDFCKPYNLVPVFGDQYDLSECDDVKTTLGQPF